MSEVDKQEKLSLFVSREVYHNESMLVEDLLKDGKFNYEDIENFTKTDEELTDEGFENIQEARDNGEDAQEIFEWWRCSDWLIERLAAKKEPILRTDYGDYWGRTCTGQAIFLDSVIEQIWDDLQKI